MNSITSNAKFRQRVIRYFERNGVTAASIRHRVSRNAIYEWKAKYNGSWKSMRDRSHRPNSHPNQQTKEELELVERCYRYTKDKMMLWDRLCEKGYSKDTSTIGKHSAVWKN